MHLNLKHIEIVLTYQGENSVASTANKIEII